MTCQPRSLDLRAAQCLEISPAATAQFRASDGSIVEAAPHALLVSLLPPMLACAVSDVIMPRLFTECASSVVAGGKAMAHARLGGILRVSEPAAPEAYRLTAALTSPEIRIANGVRDFSVALAQHGDSARMVLQGNFGARRGTLSIPIAAWNMERGTFTSTFELERDRELWTRREPGAASTEAIATLQRLATPAFDAAHASACESVALQKLLRASNPLPVEHFHINAEPLTGRGHRVTNETSSAFPRFSIRGGAYLGVGSAQNYDHLTAARSDLAILIDIDPKIADDHRGILTLVGHARSSAHFLSMLFGVRLSPQEEQLSVNELISRLPSMPFSQAYSDECRARLEPHLSANEMNDVRRIMDVSRKEFLDAWARRYARGEQGHWLNEVDRFNHLKYLQNAGRIIVRTADLIGATTMHDLATEFALWNEHHTPPIELNAIYLSNAEGWIDKEYAKLQCNLDRLPVNPDGVILRTGTFQGTDDGHWNYQTLSIRDYRAAGKVGRVSAMTRAVGDANAKHAAREQAMRELADRLDGAAV